MSTSKTGKHGHAKCNFVAIDIFTGKKYEDIIPSTHTAHVPNVVRIEYSLVDISADDFCSLMAENGDVREDVKLPDYPDNFGREIRAAYEEGKSLAVSVLTAMGKDQIVAMKEKLEGAKATFPSSTSLTPVATSSNSDISAFAAISQVSDGSPSASAPNTATIQVSQQMAVIPNAHIQQLVNERDCLEKELRQAKLELFTVLEESRQRREDNFAKDAEIKELKAANEVLKQRLETVELRLARMEAKQEYSRFLVAIQDINGYFRLERAMPDLVNVRDDRNTCHFILNTSDSPQFALWKTHKVLLEITKLSPRCQEKIIKKFGPNFLARFEQVVRPRLVSSTLAMVTDEEKTEVDEIWEDLL